MIFFYFADGVFLDFFSVLSLHIRMWYPLIINSLKLMKIIRHEPLSLSLVLVSYKS